MKKILTIIISLLILISSAGCLEKKSKIGSITGYVTTDGNTSSGVTVAVENFSIRTTTNSSGYYSLTGILEGQYSIRFSKSCYSNVSINVTVVGGANTTANLVNLSSSLGSISGTARLEGQYDYT